jgi:large subunit ribosomal protein L5
MSQDEKESNNQKNVMLNIKINKVVANISVGKSGEPLEKAIMILEELSGQKPCVRKAKRTIREFGVRKKESVACLVTLRGRKAKEFLSRTLKAVDQKVSKSSFDKQGNFSFGLKEHIDIPGTKYSPKLGITGMDITVNLERPGYRIKRRHRSKSKIGSAHLFTPNEAEAFISDEFGVDLI